MDRCQHYFRVVFGGEDYFHRTKRVRRNQPRSNGKCELHVILRGGCQDKEKGKKEKRQSSLVRVLKSERVHKKSAKTMDTRGIEPLTFHMRSENHTPRPRAQVVTMVSLIFVHTARFTPAVTCDSSGHSICSRMMCLNRRGGDVYSYRLI